MSYKTTLVAQAHTCHQYSPDGFENVTKTLIIKPETTVAELLEWYQAVINFGRNVPFNGMIYITVAETKNDN